MDLKNIKHLTLIKSGRGKRVKAINGEAIIRKAVNGNAFNIKTETAEGYEKNEYYSSLEERCSFLERYNQVIENLNKICYQRIDLYLNQIEELKRLNNKH